MRILAKDLANHLKRGLANFYIVFGDEALQQKEAIDAIRDAVKPQGFIEREVFEINARFDWNALENSVNALSLFGDKRLIECHLHDGKLGKPGADALKKMIEKYFPSSSTGSTSSSHSNSSTYSTASNGPPNLSDVLFLFTASKLDTKTQQSQWFTTLERHGCSVQVRALSPKETLLWLEQRLLAAGYKASPDAIQCLFERTEGNLLAAAQAIEKLDLSLNPKNSPVLPDKNSPILPDKNSSVLPISPDKNSALLPSATPLSATDILNAVSNSASFTVFDLVDATLIGPPARTSQILTCLRNEGIDPILIVWAVAREVRTLISLNQQLNSGKNLSTAFREQGVWKYREPLINQFFKRFPESQHRQAILEQSLLNAKKLDDRIKGRGNGSVWDLLFITCLTLSGAVLPEVFHE